MIDEQLEVNYQQISYITLIGGHSTCISCTSISHVTTVTMYVYMCVGGGVKPAAGLGSEIKFTRLWTDTQFIDNHFQHSITVNNNYYGWCIAYRTLMVNSFRNSHE